MARQYKHRGRRLNLCCKGKDIVTGVNHLGPDLHFYGVPAEKAPQRDGEYHVFLQLKESIIYVGTMYIFALYRSLDTLCCNMHGWKTEIILS